MTDKLPEHKMAPVQGWPQGIPWSLHLEAYAAYCEKWGPQPALIEGWCRGGFGTKELDEFIPGWRDKVSEITRLRTENADLRAEAQIAASVAKTNEDALRATLKQAREALEHLNNVYSGDSDLVINALSAIDKVQP